MIRNSTIIPFGVSSPNNEALDKYQTKREIEKTIDNKHSDHRRIANTRDIHCHHLSIKLRKKQAARKPEGNRRERGNR